MSPPWARADCGSANWLVVCNSGMVTGALAVGTESETLCEGILHRAMNSLRSKLRRFTTNQGAMHEGFTYLAPAQSPLRRGFFCPWSARRFKRVPLHRSHCAGCHNTLVLDPGEEIPTNLPAITPLNTWQSALPISLPLPATAPD